MQCAFSFNAGAGVKNSTVANFASPIWVTPVEILGGDLGFSITIPFGTPDVSAAAVLSSPRIDRIVAGREHDAVFNVGDIYLASFVGWHAGNFHWTATALGVAPSGSFENGQLSNIALNRPALDLSVALTYLDPVLGYELSVVPGITFNWINPATRYLTGTEFHLEWSASKYLSKDLSIGLVGYFYDQLTGDSGSGDRIGPFKGRVVSLGDQVGYTFHAGEIPISTSVRVYREFDVRNRFQGTATYLTISAPLWVAPPKATAEAKPVVVKYSGTREPPCVLPAADHPPLARGPLAPAEAGRKRRVRFGPYRRPVWARSRRHALRA